MSWLDGPFFDLLGRFADMATYWYAQAIFVGQIIMALAICFNAMKWAFGAEIQKDVIKLLMSMVVCLFLMYNYVNIMSGLRGLIYQWGFDSTYTQGVQEAIEDIRNDNTFWDKKSQHYVSPDAEEAGEDPGKENAPGAYSDIIKEISVTYGDGQVGTRYVLDLFDDDTNFIRPNAIMRFALLITERINKQIHFSLKEIGECLSLYLSMLAVLLSTILGVLQYVLCALEFMLISSIGIIFIPFMLWDGSKFLTEKLIGCVIGFTVKLLVITICIQLCTTGYIELLRKDFTGQWDQVVYTIFISLAYTILCQSAPVMAVSMLTGSPQLSLGEGMQAVAAYATAGAAGGFAAKQAGKAGVTAAVQTTGAVANAAGGYAGGGLMGSLGAIAGSVKQTGQSMVHGLAGSLIGRPKEQNKFSNYERFKNQNTNPMAGMGGGGKEDPQHHTLGSYAQMRFEEAKTAAVGFNKASADSEGSGRNRSNPMIYSSGEAVPLYSNGAKGNIGSNNTKSLPSSNVIYGGQGKTQLLIPAAKEAKEEGTADEN